MVYDCSLVIVAVLNSCSGDLVASNIYTLPLPKQFLVPKLGNEDPVSRRNKESWFEGKETKVLEMSWD